MEPPISSFVISATIMWALLTGDVSSEELQRSNGIYFMKLKGSPVEMGRTHGRLLKEQIRSEIAAYRKQIIDMFGTEKGESLLNFLTVRSGFREAIQKELPHVHEEMKGIAEGAGVPFGDILLLNMYDEVFKGAEELELADSNAAGKCTSLVCTNKDHLPNFNAQNMDWMTYSDGKQLMIHYDYQNGLEILMYTFAGQVGGVGVNSHGLSTMCNFLPAGSSRQNDGLGSVYVLRGMLEKRSVLEATEWLAEIPHFAAYNYSLADLTEACMLEVSPKIEHPLRLEIPKSKLFLTHANHAHKIADRNPSNGTDEDGNPVGNAFGNTLARQESADRLLMQAAGKATVRDLKKILTSSPVNSDDKVFHTLQSIIVVHDINIIIVHASAGNNPQRKWNSYKLLRH